MTGEEISLRRLREGTAAPPTVGRRLPYLTQAEVADAAGIDRSAYNALENQRGRTLTPKYARRLEPILGPRVWECVSDPPELPLGLAAAADQSARLRAVEDEVARISASLVERNEIAASMLEQGLAHRETLEAHAVLLQEMQLTLEGLSRRLRGVEDALGQLPASERKA